MYPGHLHNDCGASIHQEGECREKINGLNKPRRMSHLSEGELHVEKYLSCESFDKVVVKGTRFPKKLRMYCLGKAEWKCKSGD